MASLNVWELVLAVGWVTSVLFYMATHFPAGYSDLLLMMVTKVYSKRVKVEAARPLRIQPQKCHFCWVLLAKVGQRLIRSNPDECPPLEGISRKVTLQRSESIWMIRIHEHRLQFISALAVYWVQVRNNSSVDLCVMFQQT